MNGPQRTTVSRKELWQKRKQKKFLIIFVSSISSPLLSVLASGGGQDMDGTQTDIYQILFSRRL